MLGGCDCGDELVLVSDEVAQLWWWLVLFIEAPVLFPNTKREGRQQWLANLKGDS